MTKFKDNAQTRSIALFSPAEGQKRIDSNYYVEGYAAKYDPYVLYVDYDGTEIKERFDKGCFDGCDMSDIIFQYDHEGKVFARNSNGTLIVEADENGLFTAADLGKTEAARGMYDEIVAGMVTKMSWRFRVGDYYFDKATNTIVHTRVAKIYDVSAVSIPANDQTEINARAWVDGVIDLATRRDEVLEERRRKIRLKIKLMEGETTDAN
jgi:HK97 family phage prohead protease